MPHRFPKVAFLLKKFPVHPKPLPSSWDHQNVGPGSVKECDPMNDEGTSPVRKNRVRELRENRLMTQAQLARKAKVALRTIHSVEKGMNCRMDTKRKILLALGLRFEDKDQGVPPLHPSRDPIFGTSF
jgi:DNA-binding XRE family transcriptional regulator